MRSRLFEYKIFLIFLLLVFVLDQFTKLMVSCFINHTLTLIPNFFSVSLSYNTGAAWSILSGHSLLLGVFGIIVICLILFFRENLELFKPLNQLIYSLLCGGILGNAVDRITYGYVIDFIDIDLGFYHWPIFNIADIAICFSVIIYFMVAFFYKKSRI